MSSSPAALEGGTLRRSPHLPEEVGEVVSEVPPSCPSPVLSGPGRVPFSLLVRFLLESMYLSPYFRRAGT